VTKILPAVVFLLASVSALGAGQCNARSGHSDAAGTIFDDASPLLNTTVKVRGLLHWTFENRNLFPQGTSTDHISSKICLPVLITSDSRALLELAKKKDGYVVTVSGRIVDVAPPGMVSVTSCKPVGIEVTAIE